jgi:uncharacterized protein (UPF0264 family)
MDLLVSVRSAVEAQAALTGGAGLIDVKEPAHGSLGRAKDATIEQVVQAVAGRRPVSAALGEWIENPAPYTGPGLAFQKYGLAGCGGRRGWHQELAVAVERVEARRAGCRVVTVAYADWERAGAPPVGEVVQFACRRPGGVLLLDTYGKGDGRTLLDWLSLGEIARLCRLCRDAGIRIALAGSLGADEIRRLLGLRPNWFAVRGAACAGGRRRSTVSAQRVRALTQLLAGAAIRAG